MRGDSLRDLYAKGLAVLGLGLLAGAGAVVDFWPTANDMPRVARNGLTMPALARALPRNPLQTLPEPTAVHASARIAARPLRTLAPIPDFRVAVGSRDLALAGGLSLPSARPSIRVHPVSSEAPVGALVELTMPVLASDVLADTTEPPDTVAPATPSDEDGFLSDAVKKTGTSILRTGVRTGTSIRDAMRALGGAVRRAFPG